MCKRLGEKINFRPLQSTEIYQMLSENLQRGILYMVIASFCFALTGACTRLLGGEISSVELVFFRNVVGVGFIAATLLKRPIKQKGGKPFLLIFRGIIGTLALYTFFYSITQIGLAEAITYQQTYPIWLALLSFFILKEYLKRREWWAILLGFGGILLIFLPQMTGGLTSTRNHSIGIINGVLTALAYLSIRGLSEFYDTRSIVLSFMLSGIILPIISMTVGEYYDFPNLDFMISKFVMPSGTQWFWIALLGVAAMIGQIFLTKAFAYGKAGPISVAGYSNIIFSVCFGILLGDAIPAWLSFAGIILVISSGILISWKRRLRQ
jgi:drug/metabolite transporter (DMT)-like permease